jgi:hypothetical protein
MTCENERPPPYGRLLSAFKAVYDWMNRLDPALATADPLLYRTNKEILRVNWLAITEEIPPAEADRILAELMQRRFHRFIEYARSRPDLFPDHSP